MRAILWAVTGTGFTFLMTALGASLVFFFRKRIGDTVNRIFLGFAAGVMIAASVWSLLIPAIEEAEAAGQTGWIPAAGGLVLGILFIMMLDVLLPHLHINAERPEGLRSAWKRRTLLMLAVTLHNIPEGMAVGLSFALAAQHSDSSSLSAALALALGIGIQNFPEGAAISLPAQTGRPVSRQIVSLRRGKRRCGTCIRAPGRTGCRRNSAAYAVAAFFCCRRDALRCGRRTDSGGASGRAFKYRNAWRYGRFSDYDGFGRCARLKRLYCDASPEETIRQVAKSGGLEYNNDSYYERKAPN